LSSKNVAIILAAGNGGRFGSEIPKQFVKLNGKSILSHTVSAVRSSPLIDLIIVVYKGGYKEIAEKSGADIYVEGGETRNLSTLIGLKACPPETENVLIHDAVRPFVDQSIIGRCIEGLKIFDAVDVVIPTADTIVQSDSNTIINIPKRNEMFRGQTPQAFKFNAIYPIYSKVNLDGFTDDIGVAYLNGLHCGVVLGSEWNIKITSPTDLFLAEKIQQFYYAKPDKPDLEGKTILLLGASGGIGSEVYKILKEHNCVILYPSRDLVDLSKDHLPEFLFEEKIDCIINCAGVMHLGIEKAEEIMNVNFRSNLLLIDLAKKTMKNGGNIVLVGSSSSLHGRPEFPIYSASKAATVNLTESMSEILSGYNIRINCVNPGRTNTKITDYLGITGDDSLDARDVAQIIVDYSTTTLTGMIVNIRRGINGM